MPLLTPSLVALTASTALATSTPGEKILQLLNHNFADERGQTWDTTDTSVFATNWLHYTPVGMLGKPSSNLTVARTCSRDTDGASCNTDFGRFRCNSNSTCLPAFEGGAQPPCVIAESAGGDALCVGHSFALVEKVFTTIIKAEHHLDIASLSPPTGPFLAAVRNAFTALDKKGKPIEIRVLFGTDINVDGFNPIPGFDSVQRGLETFVEEALRDVNRSHTKLVVTAAAWAAGFLKVVDVSWNHAKIIAADGNALLEGGHNLWNDDYLTSSPILDVSMYVEGDNALHAHRFLDQQWTHACTRCSKIPFAPCEQWVVSSLGAGRCATVPLLPSVGNESKPATAGGGGGGGTRTISVGRLGELRRNKTLQNDGVADRALQAMFDASSSEINLALQDVGPPLKANVIGHALPANWGVAGHLWVVESLARALLRGVRVRIVQSGLKAMDAYGVGWNPIDIARQTMFMLKYCGNTHNSRSTFCGSAVPNSLTDLEIKELACANLSITTLRYVKGEMEWAEAARCPVQWSPLAKEQNCSAASSRTFGHHAKLYFVDNATFYLGSQNVYPNNLAEWGIVVDDANVTGIALHQYWQPLWDASATVPAISIQSVKDSKGSGLWPPTDASECIANVAIPSLILN